MVLRYQALASPFSQKGVLANSYPTFRKLFTFDTLSITVIIMFASRFVFEYWLCPSLNPIDLGLSFVCVSSSPPPLVLMKMHFTNYLKRNMSRD